MRYTERMNKGLLPRRQAILDLLHSHTRALHAREIAARLHLEDAAYPGLLRVLEDLALTGAISPLAGQRFRSKREAVAERGTEREGILSVHPRGFGFVASVGHDDDLFIPEESMRGAMHGDLVTARLVVRSSRGSEGEVLQVQKRANERVAGVLRRRGKSLLLEPDDARVRGPIALSAAPELRGGLGADAVAWEGQAAVVNIIRFPEEPRETPEGYLDVVLGSPGDPKVEVAKVLVREAVEDEHAPAVLREADAHGSEVSAAALVGREDLTGIPLPTIDPEDARDHDDAVWARRNADGSYTVWVAIADVSHYVREGSGLDAAAMNRGCSIYLPDRAIPMLPPALSSRLCSLLPDTIRLCLCVEAELDAAGGVRSFRIVEGYMRSQAKLTYEGVARALGFTDRPERTPEAERLADGLRVLHDVSTALRAQRLRRGALDFDLPEARVLVDAESGAPLSIERRAEDPGVKKAYRLVEELMLLANELVARYLSAKGAPTIYRVHGAPDEDKLDQFAQAAATLGIAFKSEDAREPKKLSALLKRTSKHEKRHVFHMLLLRAMKQAAYDIANIGHFGLASQAYVHFTSPIRRYPDLVVHRSVRALLQGKPIDKSPSAVEALRTSATVASERERRAMDVEREVVDLYRALYMRDHIGEVLDGIATGLVGSGIFVQVGSPFIDVLVKAEDLGADRYELDDTGMRMVGARSGDAIALGDAMTVVVNDVAVLRRTVYGKRAAAATTPASRKAKGGQSVERRRPTEPKLANQRHVRPRDPGAKRGRPASRKKGRR